MRLIAVKRRGAHAPLEGGNKKDEVETICESMVIG